MALLDNDWFVAPLLGALDPALLIFSEAMRGIAGLLLMATAAIIILSAGVIALRVGSHFVAVGRSVSSGPPPFAVAPDVSGQHPHPASTPPPTFDALLQRIDWYQFERLIEIVYRKQGFLVDRRGGAKPDGGIDLVTIREGEKTAVQCKHWRKAEIGVATVRELVGAMADEKINRGVIVGISGYTAASEEFAARNAVTLLGLSELKKLLGKLDAACDPEIQALLTDRRKFCPRCNQEMVLRNATKGKRPGSQFWGCSRFPRCRHTERFAHLAENS